jgi:Cu(I)/Ag(I) efflux system membrane fusion protein
MDEPTFELREVTLGPRTEEHYIVLGGLEEGERVVTRGSFKIDSAMQIAAKASMMNPHGGQSSTGHEHHGGGVNAAAGKQIEPLELAPEILQVLDPLYISYFDFQQALAQDDFKGAQMHAVELSSVSSAIALTQGGRAEEKWASIKKQLISNLEHAEHWQDIKSVRQAFEPISLAVLELQRTFGHSSDRVTYEVYCPMAFDNKGAAWLQSSKTVNNPFFGATMLRCGEVREEFAARLN